MCLASYMLCVRIHALTLILYSLSSLTILIYWPIILCICERSVAQLAFFPPLQRPVEEATSSMIWLRGRRDTVYPVIIDNYIQATRPRACAYT